LRSAANEIVPLRVAPSRRPSKSHLDVSLLRMSARATMKTVVLAMSIIFASGVLFANLYTSIVDARSWGAEIPNSIAAAREYFKAVTPGDFFRVASPLNQFLALVALVLFWRTSRAIRMCLGVALATYVLADVLTFTYFYPRNDVMFKTAALNDAVLLHKTWAEWSTMNWIRSLVIFCGVVSSFVGLHRSYAPAAKPLHTASE